MIPSPVCATRLARACSTHISSHHGGTSSSAASAQRSSTAPSAAAHHGASGSQSRAYVRGSHTIALFKSSFVVVMLRASCRLEQTRMSCARKSIMPTSTPTGIFPLAHLFGRAGRPAVAQVPQPTAPGGGGGVRGDEARQTHELSVSASVTRFNFQARPSLIISPGPGYGGKVISPPATHSECESRCQAGRSTGFKRGDADGTRGCTEFEGHE